MTQAFAAGALVGVLGGLIGLGGAEFRLPILISVFGFGALEAVILNKALSLVVVAAALVFRAGTIPLADVVAHWPVIVNLLAGTLAGAWLGAAWAVTLRSEILYRIIAALLIAMAVILLVGHGAAATWSPTGAVQTVAGVAAGLVIGAVAALLGVAGGELLIPTLILLFGIEIKLAGSLSLATSLPTMIVAFARYSRDRSFAVIARQRSFVLAMAAGSLCGAFIGGGMLGMVPDAILLPVLAAVLVASAVKVWRHG